MKLYQETRTGSICVLRPLTGGYFGKSQREIASAAHGNRIVGLAQMVKQHVEQVAGKKGTHQRGRKAYRHGYEQSRAVMFRTAGRRYGE